jgi:hypothetical protein
MQVCWDFYHAAKHGFIALAAATDTVQQRPPPEEYGLSKLLYGLASLPGPATLGGWAFWDSVVQQPTNLKLPQLKDAARQLGVTVSPPLFRWQGDAPLVACHKRVPVQLSA